MSVLGFGTAFVRRAAERQDLVLVSFLVLTILMIILPLPTWLVDVLIGTNLSVVVLVLMVAVYLRRPVEFSTLPAVLLFTTLFRLAIAISTTRLVLVQADAGRIVQTFGELVAEGNLVVGLVTFLIITVVQFVVITRGAERGAEVAARFSLDALPGRQMAIDSDVRSGEIDATEARRRRAALQTESDFYGAMDGAMKFVKGDAIAGLIIIAVNLLGGLGVGVLQHGMPLGQAAGVYSILTVGDGLVSQLPALLMAVTAGTVVTRVAAERADDLGRDIAAQLTARPRSLQIAGLVLVGLALVPGFPATVFLTLGALFAGSGLILGLREGAGGAHVDAGRPVGAGREDEIITAPRSPIVVALGARLAERTDRRAFEAAAKAEREALLAELGVPFPGFRLARSAKDGAEVEVLIDDVPIVRRELPPDRLVLLDEPDHARLTGTEVEEAEPLWGEAPAWLAPLHAAPALRRAGVAFLRPEAAMARLVATRLPRQASYFVGIQETRTLLLGMEQRYGDLVKEVLRHVPIQKLSEVLRRLVEEDVPVCNLRTVLEALVEWGQKEKDVVLLTEYVRAALGRQICHRYATGGRTIPAYLLEASTEEAIRGSVRHTSVGSYLALGAERSRILLDVVRSSLGELGRHKGTPVMLTTMDVRRYLRSFLVSNGLDLPVLSHQEVSRGFDVQPLATIALER